MLRRISCSQVQSAADALVRRDGLRAEAESGEEDEPNNNVRPRSKVVSRLVAVRDGTYMPLRAEDLVTPSGMVSRERTQARTAE